MPEQDIRIIVGCPGSGKTYRLAHERATGRLDAIFPDGLEDVATQPETVRQIRDRQAAGLRVGVCGQFGVSIANRRLIRDWFDDRVQFDFLEPAYGDCLRNIIRDTLAGKPHGWDRACRVDAIWRRGEYELPAGIRPWRVHASLITDAEVEAFFDQVDREFTDDTKARFRRLLTEY